MVLEANVQDECLPIVMEWVRVKAEGMRKQENKVKVVFWQIREEKSK